MTVLPPDTPELDLCMASPTPMVLGRIAEMLTKHGRIYVLNAYIDDSPMSWGVHLGMTLQSINQIASMIEERMGSEWMKKRSQYPIGSLFAEFLKEYKPV